MDRVLRHRPASQAPVVIDTSLGTRDENSDDIDDFSDEFQLSPVIEESQEPGDEHAAQEEPDISAQVSEPPAKCSEQPSTQEPEKTSNDQVQTGKSSKSTRKHKHSKVECALDDVITKFTSAQSSMN